jgi:hypothetical protein
MQSVARIDVRREASTAPKRRFAYVCDLLEGFGAPKPAPDTLRDWLPDR